MAIKHEIRANGAGKLKTMILTARQAILEFCKECMGFQVTEVRHCTDLHCPLYPFRVRGKAEDTI